MTFSDDVFPADEVCEICGARLDEVVIQEFPDGSLARLCPECAADTAHGSSPEPERSPFPEDIPAAQFAVINDPLEMTRELLSPVTDLISLQSEVQAALERLAASLQRFAGEVLSDSTDKASGVEQRVKALESELEKTRTRLVEAESLLFGAATGPIAIPAVAEQPVEPRDAFEDTLITGPAPTAPTAAEGPVAPAAPVAPVATNDFATPPPVSPAVKPVAPPAPSSPEGAFTLEEMQTIQRYFNDSQFTERIRAVRRGLGKPMGNVSRVAGTEPRILITALWDIVWYQYLVDLRPQTASEDRVTLFREGMDPGELADHFKEKNSVFDDDGRLDASELEVRLLSDPTTLITEMSDEEEKALEDATEEIWNQHVRPEFNWDD